MADFNNVQLMGRLTRDPDLDHTGGGTAVVDLGLAVNEYSQGEERTNFFDVTVWGNQAENVAQYLSKGSPILLSGRLKQDRWENDQGEQRSSVKVVANQVIFLSESEDSRGSGGNSGNGGSDQEDDEFSDIPF